MGRHVAPAFPNDNETKYPNFILLGEYPGVIMTIVLRRKINYHLLQTYLPSGDSKTHQLLV